MLLKTYKSKFDHEDPSIANWSEVNLDLAHIRRMTNNVGIAQHAKYSIPDYKHGYCIDDNARALMLVGLCNKMHPGLYDDLLDTYLAFVHYMQRENGKFGNFLSFDHQFLDEYGTEDAFGRTIWSLGSLMENDKRPHIQDLLKEIVDKAYPNIKEIKSLRAAAYTLCGLISIHNSKKYQKDLIPEIYFLADFISNEYENSSTKDWNWFEEIISYDNAIIPYSLMRTHNILFEEKYLQYAMESATFLDRIIFEGNKIQLIGNEGWYRKDGKKTLFGEQPIEIPALILMYNKISILSNAPIFHDKAKLVFSWFHGKNRLSTSLYDKLTKGCKDGIDKTTINQNQGAESTICYWLAYSYLKYDFQEQG